MSIIPQDLFKHGKSTFTISEKCNFLNNNIDNILISKLGLESTLTNQHFVFNNSVLDGSNYIGGFDTTHFNMQGSSSTLIYGAELVLEGLVSNGLYSIKFTDGTNYINCYSADQTFDSDTLFSALINTISTSGSICTYYNMNGDYNTSKGTTGAITRVNQTFRIDKNRNEISIWVNDQIEGRRSISGLNYFGESWFEVRITNATQNAQQIYMKQIGLNLEC